MFFLIAMGLLCSSSCGERELLFGSAVRASHCGGLLLQNTGSRLSSCSSPALVACGHRINPGIKPLTPAIGRQIPIHSTTQEVQRRVLDTLLFVVVVFKASSKRTHGLMSFLGGKKEFACVYISWVMGSEVKYFFL